MFMRFIKFIFKSNKKSRESGTLVRDSYGKVDYVDSFGNVINSRFSDPELDKSMQKLSDSIDETYQKSNINEWIRNKYK